MSALGAQDAGGLPMDTKQIQTFITLTQTLNYQKAAELLQYAPSTLFKHIQLLEAELGAPLLCKAGRQLQLTPQGQAFLTHARRIMEQYRQAMESVSCEENLAGTLTIGGCEINTANSLLGLFEQFSKAHPETRLSMMTTHNAGVAALVRRELMDVGYLYTVGERSVPGLSTVPLYREPVYLMVAWDHPLAQRGELRYEELTGMPFVYPHDTCCFVSVLLKKLAERDVQLGNVTYLGGVHLVVEAVLRNGAMTLVPHCAAQRYADTYGLTKLKLNEEPIWAWELILYKSYDAMKPAARALVRHSIQYAQNLLRRDETGMLLKPQEE